MRVMEEAEHSRYVSQLKVEFDSCDTTATGFLDQEELTVLCRKLQLDAQLPLLLDTLLGGQRYARVNFEEFKNGFVSVLSRSLDFSTSEDDSSYLEPVVPEEVKPKFVKGTKRYGRRSRPDGNHGDPEDSPPPTTEEADSSPDGVRRAKLRRSASLDSVESLKSDEETGSQKENLQPDFQSKGPEQDQSDLGVVGGVLMAVCDQLGLNTEDLDVLLRKLDADLDRRVSLQDFQKVLRGSAPVSCSTPVRSANLQRAPRRCQAVLEERLARSTSPSLLTAVGGQRVLSRLDDGSGCTSPERVITLWTEEGIQNSREILQTLDFPLEERVSLADLTLALDNEMLVSGNGIHQAALLSYKNEIQHLQVVAEQACRERDKVKADLDQADQRNLQLVREVDDRHASMETLNQTMIRDLEQDFRDRLTALRSQSEQESEALQVQAERERRTLQDELQLLRAQEAELQEELSSATQENRRLEEDVRDVKQKLNEAESSVNRLQRDLDTLLQDKFGGLDPVAAGLSHEERFFEIVKDYELQCRKIKELRDRNDELSSELELLRNRRSDRKSRRPEGDAAALSWGASTESDSDESEMKRSSSPLVRKKLQPVDKTGLGSLDQVSGPAVSIQTELALETLKQKHNEELQQLHIQLDTQVNYYERTLEVMRQSMEVERKDISQAFKMEISELEDQKAQAEQQVKQLKEKLLIQHGGGGGGWSHEQERRMQRERAELEQNFAREIGHLVQRLSSEKEQLEAELKLKMDQDLMLVRPTAELDSLKTDRARLIQDLKEQAMAVDALQLQLDRVQEEVCRLSLENAGYARLADHLAAQIVEMEAEISTLRDHLGELSAQLNSTADLVLDLRTQLNSKTGQVDRLRAEVADAADLLRRVSSSETTRGDAALQDSRDRLRTAERDFEEEKKKMKQQLMELERLVLALEGVMDPASPHRTQLEEVRLENGALQERLSVLQQEVHSLEDDVAKKRRKLEDMEQEHERSREEEERLHKENSRYREEVLDLSSRNLQLSNDNAELSARLHGDQESARMLRERLATVSKEQEEAVTMVRRLQDAALQRETETLQRETEALQERQQLETEQRGRVLVLEAELSAAALKLQRTEEDKSRLLREADARNNKVETLQQSLVAVETEAELLRSQLQERLCHAQEVTSLHRKLQDAQTKVEELESRVWELRQDQQDRQDQTSVALQEETQRLRVQNQDLQHQQQNLKTRLSKLEAERTQDQDQQVWRRQAADGCREQTEQLQARLMEEQKKSRQLEEQKKSVEDQLRLQSQQSSAHISMKQDQYEKALSALQQRMEELETKLKGVRMVLQEKVQQLKEQLEKSAASSVLLKDLYVENSQLMAALQVTEQRQKQAEKKNFQLEDKVSALTRLLQEIVPEALAT